MAGNGPILAGASGSNYIPLANAPALASITPAAGADGGQNPGANPLTIGSVTFNSGECPNDLSIGLEQKLKVTELIGGGRVTHTFGAQPDEISWSGRFWGPNVKARVQALRQLEIAANEVVLTWTTERYYCIVKKFVPKYLAIDCEYTLTISVTRDANGSLSSALPTSVDTQVSTIVSNAQTNVTAIAAVDSTNGAALQTQLSTVQQSIASAGPLAQLYGPALTAVSTAVNVASAVAAKYAATLLPTATQYVAAQQLTTAFNLIGQNVVKGQNAQVVSVVGGSPGQSTMTELAAQYYGNADLGPDLAAANGIQGLRLPPGVSLNIALPPFPTSL